MPNRPNILFLLSDEHSFYYYSPARGRAGRSPKKAAMIRPLAMRDAQASPKTAP